MSVSSAPYVQAEISVSNSSAKIAAPMEAVEESARRFCSMLGFPAAITL